MVERKGGVKPAPKLCKLEGCDLPVVGRHYNRDQYCSLSHSRIGRRYEGHECERIGCKELVFRKRNRFCSQVCSGFATAHYADRALCALDGCTNPIRYARGKFCSRSCSGKQSALSNAKPRTRLDPKPCARQGCTDQVHHKATENPAAFKARKYCSHACYSKTIEPKPKTIIEPRPCSICGGMIPIRDCDYPAGYATKRFCSYACMGVNYQTNNGKNRWQPECDTKPCLNDDCIGDGLVHYKGQQPHRWQKTDYCSLRCAGAAKKGIKKVFFEPRECAWEFCRKTFTPKRKGMVMCGPKCSNEHAYRALCIHRVSSGYRIKQKQRMGDRHPGFNKPITLEHRLNLSKVNSSSPVTLRRNHTRQRRKARLQSVLAKLMQQ